MADDERAAKAARAKALLKKRQQQKKAGSGTAHWSTIVQSQSPPVSRPMTPAPSQGNDGAGALASSPTTQEATEQVKPEPVQSGTLQDGSEKKSQNGQESSRLLQDQRQTITLLVSEKAALAEALGRVEGIESKLYSNETELEKKLQELGRLRADLSQVEEERNTFSVQLQGLGAQNTLLTTKLREQERESHIIKSEADRLRSQMFERERRTRELEEQIQNDDRVEILETNLKNTQDRAEEVAFQLSKLKQSHDKLKEDHEYLHKELSLRSATEEELKRRVADLEDKLQSSEDKLSAITAERDTLSATNSSFASQLQASQETVGELELKFSHATSDLVTLTRQLESSQTELRVASRRAEDTERARRDLQEEGTGLIRSLAEMRPKIVELTGAKLELTEKVDLLTKSLDQRDSTISDLEGQLGHAQEAASDARRGLERVEMEKEKERHAAETNLAELQRAYSELQNQLDDALANARELEADRGKQRQVAVRLQEEINNLFVAEQSRSEEMTSLQLRLEERQHAREDESRLLDDLQQEIEILRSELASKEDEICRLREAASSSPSSVPQSLNDEFQSALRQQYELELSTAQSTIRSLETSVYDAEARYHSLQKQAAAMEDNITRLRSMAKAQKLRSFSSRDSTSARRSDDLRRTSFGSQRSDSASRLPPSALIDENLPPATRHQRHVSLAMLQARMFSEAEVASIHIATSKAHVSPESLASIHEHPSLDSSQPPHRPQFLDESHVFWCASCKDDLIVL